MSVADYSSLPAASMSSCTDEDIAARASLEEARAATNALLAHCGDFVSPSGEFGPLQVAIIPGAGRCFYDAVLHQLAESGGAGLVAHAEVLMLSMLEALSTCRDHFEEMLIISERSDEVQLMQRKSYVLQEGAYMSWMDRLTDFDYYILDKAEAVLRSQPVLDTRQYVESYEMQAWTRFVGDMRMLLVRPGQQPLAIVVDETGKMRPLYAYEEVAACTRSATWTLPTLSAGGATRREE